jgi:hypothetical protein
MNNNGIPVDFNIDVSHPLLESSAICAQSQLERCIRATLRETFMQVLRQQLKIQRQPQVLHNDELIDPINASMTVEITTENLTIAQLFCRRIAYLWQEKLRESGYREVAGWVDNVIKKYETSFYDEDPTQRTKVHLLKRETIAVLETRNDTDGSSSNDSPRTAWTRLRKMGEHDVAAIQEDDDSQARLQNAIHTLDDLGEKNKTYWIKDQWSLIQMASQEIVSRLYNGGKRPGIAAMSRHGDCNHLVNTDKDLDTAQTIINRKRKSISKKRVLLQLPSKRMATSPSLDDVIQDEQPRAPSVDTGHISFSLENDILSYNVWTSKERMELDSCMHDSEEATGDGNEPKRYLLGALVDLGRFHFSNQLNIDHDEIQAQEWTEKQRRRRQRGAVQERLGDHTRTKDTHDATKLTRLSRVIRSTTGNQLRQQFWMDLDLCSCVLDIATSAEGRSLHAFRSLELLLVDEDDDM